MVIKRFLLISFTAIFVLGLYVSVALAAGISPGSIELKDAMRGREFKRSLTIFNTDTRKMRFLFEPKVKPVSDWITVLDSKSKKKINSVEVPAKKSKSVTINVKIPNDTANGDYKGNLNMVPREAKEKKQSGATLIPSLAIWVGVTDKQVINADVTTFVIDNTEAGEPLDIHLGVRNKSNVEITPTLMFSINRGEDVLKQASFQMKEIDLDRVGNEVFTLGLGSAGVGKYEAIGIIKFQDVESKQMKYPFSIVSPGTFSKAVMKSFEAKGQASVGESIKLVGQFSSQSPKILEPKFVADVYLDGLKIGSMESSKRKIYAYKEEMFETSLKITKPGSYKIDGYFVFNGKESNHKTVMLNPADGLLKYLNYYITNYLNYYKYIGSALLLLVIIVLYFVYKRSRTNSPQIVSYKRKTKIN